MRLKKHISRRLPASDRKWLQGRDLNPRPPGYEPDELPDCSTLRQVLETKWWARRDLNPHTHLRAMDFKSIVSAIPPLARGKEALNSSEFSKPYCNRSPPICQGFFLNYATVFFRVDFRIPAWHTFHLEIHPIFQ